MPLLTNQQSTGKFNGMIVYKVNITSKSYLKKDPEKLPTPQNNLSSNHNNNHVP